MCGGWQHEGALTELTNGPTVPGVVTSTSTRLTSLVGVNEQVALLVEAHRRLPPVARER